MELIPDFLNQLEKVSNDDQTLFEAFKLELTRKISHLLEHQPNQLFNFFYRFDLDENQVKAAIFGAQSKNTVAVLVELIIKRALEKIEMRKRYR